MEGSLASLDKQRRIEQRFNCVVCLCARFQMVYGQCQHRICTSCAYTTSGLLRQEFHRCPSCQQQDAFPDKKPTIPEDNIELQKMLGVVACQNEGCTQEFWFWERTEHDLTCSYKNSPRRKKRFSDTVGETDSFSIKPTTRKTKDNGRREYTLRSTTYVRELTRRKITRRWETSA